MDCVYGITACDELSIVKSIPWHTRALRALETILNNFNSSQRILIYSKCRNDNNEYSVSCRCKKSRQPWRWVESSPIAFYNSNDELSHMLNNALIADRDADPDRPDDRHRQPCPAPVRGRAWPGVRAGGRGLGPRHQIKLPIAGWRRLRQLTVVRMNVGLVALTS